MEFKTYDFFDQFFNSSVIERQRCLFNVPKDYESFHSIRYLLMLYLMLHPEYSEPFTKYMGLQYKYKNGYYLIWENPIDVYKFSEIDIRLQGVFRNLISKQDRRSEIFHSLYLSVFGTGSVSNPTRIEICYDGKLLVEMIPLRSSFSMNYYYVQSVRLNKKNLIKTMQNLLDEYGKFILKLAAFPVHEPIYSNPYEWIIDEVYYQYLIPSRTLRELLNNPRSILSNASTENILDNILIPVHFVAWDENVRYAIWEDDIYDSIYLDEVSNIYQFIRHLTKYFACKFAREGRISAYEERMFEDTLETHCYAELRKRLGDFSKKDIVNMYTGHVISTICTQLAIKLHPLFVE